MSVFIYIYIYICRLQCQCLCVCIYIYIYTDGLVKYAHRSLLLNLGIKSVQYR